LNEIYQLLVCAACVNLMGMHACARTHTHSLQINTEKTKYTFMSHCHNAGQVHNIWIDINLSNM